MMLTDNFQITVPTRISFVLYKHDNIDSIIISRALKECKNISVVNDEYTFHAVEFMNAIRTSPRLRTEIAKIDTAGLNSSYKPNSLYFLIGIITSLTNLQTITFRISDEKDYSRIINYENKNFLNFYYKIEEGLIDLTKMLERDELDYINQVFINLGLMSNEYLERSAYFYVKTSNFLDALSIMIIDEDIAEKIYELIDPKIDEDDPILLIKTDYTHY